MHYVLLEKGTQKVMFILLTFNWRLQVVSGQSKEKEFQSCIYEILNHFIFLHNPGKLMYHKIINNVLIKIPFSYTILLHKEICILYLFNDYIFGKPFYMKLTLYTF